MKEVHEPAQPRWRRWVLVGPAILLAIALLPLVLIILVAWFVRRFVLLVVVWARWPPQGKRALVVYSNSPVWQSYFETTIIPPLSNQSIVLNWSERKTWKHSLAVQVFRCFAPAREFNPMVIVFARFRRPQYFRFYDAFRAYKHGRPQEVDEIAARMFEALGIARTEN